MNDIVRHEELMRVCFKLAVSAREKGNHPFGALLALDDRVMLTAENTVVTDRNVTGHAELNLVSAASNQFAPELIKNLTLYTSTEPCAMCAGAIYWSGIRSIFYGCSAETLGEMAGGDFIIPCRHIFRYAKQAVAIVGPILEKEAALVHEGFWSL